MALDCRNGLQLQTLQVSAHAGSAQAWSRASQAVDLRLQLMGAWASHWQALHQREPSAALGQVLFHLKRRLDRWQERHAALTTLQPTAVTARDYADMFSLLLDLHGQSYEAVGNRFRSVNWHIARSMDEPSAITARGQDLRLFLTHGPWSVAAGVALLLMLAWGAWRWRGWWLMAGFCATCCLGLLVVADATVRFGEGSPVFAFNPLGNQLARQSRVLWLVGGLLVAVVLLVPRLGPAVRWAGAHLGWLMVGLLGLTLAGYGAMGPASGSELLKVGMACAAGLLTATQGRSVYLASELAPRALHPLYLAGQALRAGKLSTQPVAMISRSLSGPIVQMALFCTLSLATAALVFNDLGATLVTAFIAVCALFFVFGPRITLAVVTLMAAAAVVVSQTDKVQTRISLMLDPLNASISDFARLVAFEQAAPAAGLALGQVPWCSGAGVCIPLQSLSDYMPVVLAGALGRELTVAYFLSFLTVLMVLSAWLVHQYLTRSDLAGRALSMTAFYLLLATLVQTVVTFLGNWRVIPLTGLGTPLVSIGLSSVLAPTLALGLILGLQRLKPAEVRA
jgi:cell division protein FtsW (lipid II flippase)